MLTTRAGEVSCGAIFHCNSEVRDRPELTLLVSKHSERADPITSSCYRGAPPKSTPSQITAPIPRALQFHASSRVNAKDYTNIKRSSDTLSTLIGLLEAAAVASSTRKPTIGLIQLTPLPTHPTQQKDHNANGHRIRSTRPFRITPPQLPNHSMAPMILETVEKLASQLTQELGDRDSQIIRLEGKTLVFAIC